MKKFLKIRHANLFALRFGLASLLWLGFGIASLIRWGNKPDQDPNCPPVSLLEPFIGIVGPAFVAVIYFCTSSTIHWLLRKQDIVRTLVWDVALWLIAFVALFAR